MGNRMMVNERLLEAAQILVNNADNKGDRMAMIDTLKIVRDRYGLDAQVKLNARTLEVTATFNKLVEEAKAELAKQRNLETDKIRKLNKVCDRFEGEGLTLKRTKYTTHGKYVTLKLEKEQVIYRRYFATLAEAIEWLKNSRKIKRQSIC